MYIKLGLVGEVLK